MKKTVLTLGKFLIAFAVLAVVLYHSDHQKILRYMAALSLPFVLLSVLLYNVAQLFSAQRMQYYYRCLGYTLSYRFSLMLYYVGMFYNLIFPGGIGGDAYRVYLLKRRSHIPVGDGIRLLFANRANGLYVLTILMLGFTGAVGWQWGNPFFLPVLLLLLVVTTLMYFWGARLFWGETTAMTLGALPMSVAVQVLTTASVIALWCAMGNPDHLPEYILLFLAASIVGVLPISVGGLGIREFVFFYGAGIFNSVMHMPIDPELGVALSLLFFAVSTVSALPGMVWLHRVSEVAPAPLSATATAAPAAVDVANS